MAKEEKKSDFVVSDRRKFTSEGDLRPDAPVEKEEPAPAPVAPSSTSNEDQKAAPRPAETEAAAPGVEDEPQMPPPPTDEEAAAQRSAYDESTRTLNDQLKERMGGRDTKQFE